MQRIPQMAYLCMPCGYILVRELRRTPSRRSSQNSSSPALGEKGPVGREDGISMPDRVMASIVLGRGLLAL